MSSTQITEIVTWIRAHPEHYYESDVDAGHSFEGCTPAETWFLFCQNSLLVNEYEDPDDHSMNGREMVNGCNHIFRRGCTS
jgi:hypothetical protein